MQVDLKAYWEQVKQFSQYPEDALATGYMLGLTAEVGECFGAVDKWLRGRYDEEEMKRRLLDELGDVCWYAAANWNVWGDDGDGIFYPVIYFVSFPLGRLAALMDMATYQNVAGTLDMAASLAIWAGSDLQAVLDANVAKLRARHGAP